MSKTNTKPQKFSWKDLLKAVWYFLKEDRTKYIFYAFILLLIYSYPFVLIYFIGLIAGELREYNSGESLRHFYNLVLITSISYIAVSAVRLIGKRNLDYISTNMVYRAKVEGFERLMDFSIKWHQSENTGNKVQRIQTGVNKLRELMHTLVSKIFDVLVSFIAVFSIFLFLGLDFFIFVLIYMVLFFSVEYYFYKKVKKANDEFNESNEKSSGTYYESASNVLTIKTLGAKDNVKKNVNLNEEQVRERTKEINSYAYKKWQYFQFVSGISLGIFLLMIGNEVVKGVLTIEFVFVYYTYFDKLRNAVQTTTEAVGVLIEQKSGVERMMPIFWTEDNFAEGKEKFPLDWKKVQIVNGEFSYKVEGDEFKIKKLNIDINRYQKIGIVGHSGSGKSTLAKLMLRVYELESGELCVDNINFSEIQHSELTKRISTVLQETELFNISFKENITMMKEYNAELFEKVVSISQLENIIQKLPNGIESLIGEKGYKLSGGERQRLGIARAIYSNAEILILDEATSSLDSKTESLIQTSIERELTKKTLIIIAHRLSTLKNVDKIYVFEKGEIVEQGDFHTLLNDKSSKFAEMYKLQSK